MGCIHAGHAAAAAQMPAGSAAVFGAAVIVLATVRITAAAAGVVVLAGIAWIGALSTLNAAMQLTLPAWGRARGLAFYLVVFQGGRALGSLVWGLVAAWSGLRTALLAAAGLLLAGAAAGWLRRSGEQTPADPTPTSTWAEPALVVEPAPSDGPVLVLVDYRVAPSDRDGFQAAMDHVERSRRRTGAMT